MLPLTLAAFADVADALVLMVVGMLAVFCALMLLLGVVILINRLWKVEEAPVLPKAEPKAAKPLPKKAVQQSMDGVSPELIAVLTAAATAALQQSVRISRVRFVGQRQNAIWAQLGRRSIMSSHHLRRSR